MILILLLMVNSENWILSKSIVLTVEFKWTLVTWQKMEKLLK